MLTMSFCHCCPSRSNTGGGQFRYWVQLKIQQGEGGGISVATLGWIFEKQRTKLQKQQIIGHSLVGGRHL